MPARRRILVVDDHVDLADVGVMLARHLGHHALACYSGENCLHLLSVFQPDVILLDLCMPGMDGFETCRRIRADEWMKKPALVACTALAPEAFPPNADDCRFDWHIMKPFGLARLGRAIDQSVARTDALEPMNMVASLYS